MFKLHDADATSLLHDIVLSLGSIATGMGINMLGNRKE